MPKWEVIQQVFKGIGLFGAYNIRWFNYKHILINLLNEYEYDFKRIWGYQAWFIANQKMEVFKWSLDLNPEKTPSIVLVWISFPNLKLHLFEKSMLLAIAKSIENLLYVNESPANGTKPSMARVYVEYDCFNPLVDSI
ncbi:Uncharacterized protein TCM_035322 [Theobroma cacao]|uniref:Uncharacterized protein n=1 Tax=Theobroma cacao TaxID=3641 RepID=A0A061FGP6_THECC|nr:Uncharacterized protein TCM_035322 [Theobroma cacao]